MSNTVPFKVLKQISIKECLEVHNCCQGNRSFIKYRCSWQGAIQKARKWIFLEDVVCLIRHILYDLRYILYDLR